MPVMIHIFSGDLGGTMGLFFGASIFSVLEILQFICTAIVQKCMSVGKVNASKETTEQCDQNNGANTVRISPLKYVEHGHISKK